LDHAVGPTEIDRSQAVGDAAAAVQRLISRDIDPVDGAAAPRAP